MKILIAGDFVPQDRVASLFNQSQYGTVLDDVKQYTDEADYSIVNLEAPIVVSDNCEPISKIGPNLKTNTNAISAIKYAGFNVVSLANNHLRDYGDWGVNDTLFYLTKEGVDFVGAGLDLNEASVTLCKSIDKRGGGVISVISCCEHEFSIAGTGKAGSNPLNPIQQYYAIQEAKRKSDYVVVIVHGGIEHFNLPTPRMKETYRFFIDAGADAVINHHQHCYSGYEMYNGKPIFYGLGNFCFDRPQHRNDFWNMGYMVMLDLNDDVNFRLIPYNQCSDEPKVRVLDNNGYEDFVEALELLNNCIIQDDLQERISAFFDKNDKEIKALFSPYRSRKLTSLYVHGFLPGFMTKKKWLSLSHKIACESHRERLLRVLHNRNEEY